MDDIDIDKFEFDSFDDSSDSSDASSESDEEDELPSDLVSDKDEIESNDSDDSSEEEDAECRDVLIAQPPEVLEPSVQIEKCPGVPEMMKHRGFRLCGDNIDKSVHTRHMRLDRRNQSLHYFHLYAVENRINFVNLPDEVPDNSHITDFRSVAESLLPTTRDDTALKKNIATLISRILCKHVKFFQLSCDDLVKRHIQHRYYEDMSMKSLVVSLRKGCHICVMQVVLAL